MEIPRWMAGVTFSTVVVLGSKPPIARLAPTMMLRITTPTFSGRFVRPMMAPVLSVPVL